MLKSYSFNLLWMMNTTIFQGTSNLPHFRVNNWSGRLFQKIILGLSLRLSFIDPFSFAKKHCNTLQGFGAFFFQSFDQFFFFFFFFFAFLLVLS